MVNLKWDLHNWITVVLMVAVAYAAVGVVKSVIAGGMPGSTS
jgi:hypothetical protein